MSDLRIPLTLTLQGGSKLPVMGLGSYNMGDAPNHKLIQHAIVDLGYRHIDTASHYNNEAFFGEVIQNALSSGIKREDLFVTTKVYPDEYHEIEAAIDRSLAKLNLPFVDLYLLHWPLSWQPGDDPKAFRRTPLHVAWSQMEAVVRSGKARNIGICNFNFQTLNDLLAYATIRPAAIQIENHPYLVQKEFVNWLHSEKIQIIAYGSLGHPYLVKPGEQVLIKDPLVIELAEKYQASPSQILLAWSIFRGNAVIPKASSPERLKENYEAQFLTLLTEDVDRLSTLDKNFRIVDGEILKFLPGHPPVFK